MGVIAAPETEGYLVTVADGPRLRVYLVEDSHVTLLDEVDAS